MFLTNPFQKVDAPDEMTRERRLRFRHIRKTAYLSLALTALALVYTPFMMYVLVTGVPVTTETLGYLWDYTRLELSNGWMAPHRMLLTNPQAIPFKLDFLMEDATQLKAIFAYLAFGLAGFTIGLLRNLTQRNLRMVMKADARWCTQADMREMEANQQVGITGGNLVALGRWIGGLRDGEMIQMIETLSVLCLAPPGTGKCLGPEEWVLMYDGTRRQAKNLRVGDLLMGPDGTPRRILHINWGYGPMYEVIPRKGRRWRCNGEHILSLRCSRTSRGHSVAARRGDVKHMTVDEWMRASTEGKARWKQWRAAVDFPNPKAPLVDPYLMGLVLGAGSTIGRTGTPTADDGIATNETTLADNHDLALCQTRKKEDASALQAFTAGNDDDTMPGDAASNALRAYGLHVTGEPRSIPHDLKTGSRETRLALLAGIIDSDGSQHPTGRGYEITRKSKRMADDIAFVARSLGLAAYPTPTIGGCAHRDDEGEVRQHTLFISGDVDRIPVRLFRVQPRPRRMSRDVTNTGFRIEPVGDGPWLGIVIDGDRQFLLDDFTVTHNTAGLVVPTIMANNTVSNIINDMKPELWDMTGAYKSQHTCAFMLNWAATDSVPMRQKVEAGTPVVSPKTGAPVMEPDYAGAVFYPRFNPLSPKLVPPRGPDRDTYIDAIAKALIPDKGGGDSYFINKGRATLTGFMHCLVAMINDANDYSIVPKEYQGKEASLPMLIDWMALAQYNVSKDPEVEEDDEFLGPEEERGPPPEKPQDPMGAWIKTMAEKVDPNAHGDVKGTSERAFKELAPLIAMADKERSGMLGTMDEALLPFKNEAVKQRTSACDFTPDDLRGVVDPADGRMKAVSLYICMNQAEGAAFATITALLYEILSKNFLTFAPGMTNYRTGRKLGPYPVCFVMDEFAKLPKIDAVIMGPDLGRSMKTSYMLIAQDYGQIEKTYGKELVQTIDTTTAVKYVLSQNETSTKKRIIDMVGKTTIRASSISTQEGISKSANPFAWSHSEKVEEVDLLRDGDVTSMPPLTHILLIQKFLGRPIRARTPVYFLDPNIRDNVRARGKGPIAGKAVPDFIHDLRIEEHNREYRRSITKAVDITEAAYADAEDALEAADIDS